MKSQSTPFIKRVFGHLVVLAGAAAITAMFFLLLPIIQAISSPPRSVLDIREVDTGFIPPPDPIVEEEPEEEEEEPEEEEPPELEEEFDPLELSELEMALNPGFSDSWMGGDFGVKLKNITGQEDGNDALFSLSDLDQKPRAVHRQQPIVSGNLRKRLPATVHVLFIVNERGRVENPIVQHSSDPAFERAAVAAVKKWKFEPGKRNGKPVSSRMRLPITFPKGS